MDKIEIIKDIEELKLNKVYGIIEIDENNNEKRELYILKGILNNQYLFDKALIIQNNNEEKLLAISDNRYNEKKILKCELEKLISQEKIVLLLELKEKICNCKNCTCK